MGHVQFGDHAFDAKLIAFDKDGTLFDFNASWRPVFVAAVERLVSQLPKRAEIRAALYRALGYDAASASFSQQALFATATSEAVIFAATNVLFQQTAARRSWESCEQQVRTKFAPMLADNHDLAPTTDLASLFSTLNKTGVAIAVITNDDRDATEAVLAHHDVLRFVGFIAAGDGPHPPKPAPDALLTACDRLGVPPEGTAVVGDSVTDLRMARAAGVGLRVGALTGVGSHRELAAEADVILASIDEIRVESTAEDGRPPAPGRS